MEVLIYAGQLILGLSILVALHEFGHFLPAKLFGMRVEKFFLFFDWPRALFRKKIGDTVYGVGALPFGGYVKIAGMVDESLDAEQKERMQRPPEPWEFRAKPVWQRLIVMVGGVTVNVLLAFAIYAMVLFVWGREYLPVKNLTYGVTPSALMQGEGFRDGDKILDVGGHEPKTLGDLSLAILIDGAREVTVEREDAEGNVEKKRIELSADIQERILESNDKQLFSPRFPFFVDSVLAGNNAAKTGSFRKGDRIIAVNGQPARYFQDFVEAVKNKRGQMVEVTLLREGHQVNIPVEVGEDGIVGLQPRSPAEYFTFETESYGLLASIPAGIKFGWQRLMDNINSFKLLGSKAGMKQMGGLIAMSKAYGPQWVWQRFWEMTAFLSLALAVLNILPIPALDGGHVVFLLYEAVARKPAPAKVLEYAQMAGMAFLLTLILAVNGHDIIKLFTGNL
ncbi:MAG: RIP metalloprotease RseP [Flavobacteriales bacterium]|nr:RIP metalloprotease RseP [Flavobacteriales bacterium]MEB2342127.1 RIP metalloprotease RseP [Flavobacteriia bacterium]